MIRLEYLIKSRPEGFGAADPRLLAVRVGPKESKASALLFPQGRRLEFQDAQRTTETSEREREREKERERETKTETETEGQVHRNLSALMSAPQ